MYTTLIVEKGRNYSLKPNVNLYNVNYGKTNI